MLIQGDKCTYAQISTILSQIHNYNAPKTEGVNTGNIMLLLGRLPSNTFDLTKGSEALVPNSCTAPRGNRRQQTNSHIETHFHETTHLPYLFLCLSKRERFWLRKEVTQQNPVMLRIRDRIVRRRRSNEVCRDEFGALVYELIERVLAVRASSAPDDRLKM